MRSSLAFALHVSVVIVAQAQDGDPRLRILEEINFARQHPKEYARKLEQQFSNPQPRFARVTPGALKETTAFLRHVRPLPALAFSVGMSAAAEDHVRVQGSRGAIGHRGVDGSSPWQRLSKHGSWTGSAGENIAYGLTDPGRIVAHLIIDPGVPGRGHRKNIFGRNFTLAGIAIGGHVRYGVMSVIEFAGGFVENDERGGGQLVARR
jgi:uncharacterized protein YkwD